MPTVMFDVWNKNVQEIVLKMSALVKASGTHKRITMITQGSDPVVGVAEDEKSKCLYYHREMYSQ